jgi:hypothetical protein
MVVSVSGEQPFGDPPSAAWREEGLARAKELEGLLRWIVAELPPDDPRRELVPVAEEHLAAARKAAAGADYPWSHPVRRYRATSGGASIQRVLSNLDAAEAHILRLAPDHYFQGMTPSIEAFVNRYLPRDDPRRIAVGAIAARGRCLKVDPCDRDTLIVGFHVAAAQRSRDIQRVRSFRNIIVGATAALLLAAIALAILGWRQPQVLPLCFYVQEVANVVCPTNEATTAMEAGAQAAQPTPERVDEIVRDTAGPWDILLVELVGLVAAALAAAVALRGIRGTAVPYSLPTALAVLKLPSGALTAVLGIVLMRGEFVPGLSALDTSAQILAWAVIFGYAQQLLTGLLDRQAQTVLDGLGGQDPAPEPRRAPVVAPVPIQRAPVVLPPAQPSPEPPPEAPPVPQV